MLKCLRSIAKQTYTDFIVVVTLFGETTVEKTVKKILGDKAVFVESTIPDGMKHCQTKVLLNAIDFAKSNRGEIILHSTGDVTWSDNLLEEVAMNYSPLFSGVSHPNIFYDIDEDFRIIRKRIGSCNQGIDVAFCDINVVANENAYKLIENFPMNGWGCFDHFFSALNMFYSKRMINLFLKSKIIKYENDRRENDENSLWMKACKFNNDRVLQRVTLRLNMRFSLIMNLKYLHTRYNIVGMERVSVGRRKLYDI